MCKSSFDTVEALILAWVTQQWTLLLSPLLACHNLFAKLPIWSCTFLQVTSAINNLIMGKIYIEHTGIMRITNLQSTMVAKIKFKESGRLSSKDAHQVTLSVRHCGICSILAISNTLLKPAAVCLACVKSTVQSCARSAKRHVVHCHTYNILQKVMWQKPIALLAWTMMSCTTESGAHVKTPGSYMCCYTYTHGKSAIILSC